MISERSKSYGVRVYRVGQGYEWIGSFAFSKYGGKREAKIAAKEAERLALKRQSKKLTVNALVDAYLADYSGKVTSQNNVRQASAHLCRHLGERNVHELTPLDALDFKSKVPAYVLPKAIAIFNWANEKWIVEKNPFRGIADQSAGRSKDAPPTKEEFDRLLDACDVLGWYAPQMRSLLRFAWGSGMRPGELFMLEWEPRIVSYKGITSPCSHVDFQSETIHVNWRINHGDIDIPKSNEQREIALTPPAAEALSGHPRRGQYVFVTKNGGQFSEATLSNYWSLVRAKASLDHEFYLSTKHACVHYMWTELGVDEADIEKQMGWAQGGAKELLKVYGHREIGFRERIQAKYRENVVQLKAVGE